MCPAQPEALRARIHGNQSEVSYYREKLADVRFNRELNELHYLCLIAAEWILSTELGQCVAQSHVTQCHVL